MSRFDIVNPFFKTMIRRRAELFKNQGIYYSNLLDQINILDEKDNYEDYQHSLF